VVKPWAVYLSLTPSSLLVICLQIFEETEMLSVERSKEGVTKAA
jgi:hypothetical protein